jgi:hypothetical protein
VRSSGAKTWVWKRLKTASTTSSFATLGWAILMSSTCGSDRAFVHDPGGGMDCEKVALHPAHVSKALGYFPYADLPLKICLRQVHWRFRINPESFLTHSSSGNEALF